MEGGRWNPRGIPVVYLAVADLPAGWRNEPPSPKTMAVGEKWVEEGKATVLKVPSVLVPAAANLVLNPRPTVRGKVLTHPGPNPRWLERIQFNGGSLTFIGR
jgi:RES domain-containing protein